MKKLFYLFIILIFALTASAQNLVRVTGVVTDLEGEVLPGVSILEKGTRTGTISGLDGKFSIKVKNYESTLIFSFIGFEKQEVNLDGRTRINITLKEAVSKLDEFVAVGYGEMRKSDVTGSVSSVKAKDEVARQYGSVDMLLQGRASGLQVVGNSGSPGGAVSVRIRGTNSLRGNNEPLYVVDGIIISTAGTDVDNPSTDANELQTQQNGLTGLNPKDIENIEILKDASATAIYGSRGANGVVLITTKSGQNTGKKPVINIYGTTEWSRISKNIDMLDGVGYAKYQNEREVINGNNTRYQIDNEKIYPVKYEDDMAVVGETPYDVVNWENEIYQMSMSHNEGISIRGSSGKSSYYFSSGYSDQKGIVETTRIRRGDLRLNLNQELSKKLKLDTRINMMYQKGTFAQAGSKSGGNRSFTKQILSYRPIIGLTEEDSEELDLEISNPYAWLSDFDDQTNELRLNGVVAFTYDIWKGLKYKINAGLDYRTKDRSKFYDTEVFVGQKENGLANYSSVDRYAYVIDNLLMYNRKIKRNHQINAVAGVTYDGVNSVSSVYEVANFADKSLRASYPLAGQLVYQPYANFHSNESIFSALGRMNYGFKDKYLLTASYRADQVSKFQTDNQWGFYPALAMAWRAMEEPFIKHLDIFHNLKLRAGWGLTGNSSIPPYQTLGTYATNYYVSAENSSIIGNSFARIPNPYLTWETTEQYNAGIDMGFFNGRLNATADVYHKNTSDLLQQIELGPSNGVSNIFMNRGEIQNRGLELALSGVILEKKALHFEIGANVSFNQNKVMELGLEPTTTWNNNVESQKVLYFGGGVSTGTYFKQPANVFMEGQPIGVFWGWQTDGIYQNADAAAAGPQFNGNPNVAGDVNMKDQNGDNNIDDLDKVIIGDPNPEFTYGLNANFRYRGLSINVLFDGVYGADIVNGYSMELAYAEGNSKNVMRETFEQAWREEAPSTTYPRIGYAYNEYLTDRIVEDGSYFRLNNLTVGYDIPLKSELFKTIHLYASGKNLFTLTNYSGYNPQVTSFLNDGTIMGVDWVGTPNVKTYLIGLNLTF